MVLFYGALKIEIGIRNSECLVKTTKYSDEFYLLLVFTGTV